MQEFINNAQNIGFRNYRENHNKTWQNNKDTSFIIGRIRKPGAHTNSNGYCVLISSLDFVKKNTYLLVRNSPTPHEFLAYLLSFMLTRYLRLK